MAKSASSLNSKLLRFRFLDRIVSFLKSLCYQCNSNLLMSKPVHQYETNVTTFDLTIFSLISDGTLLFLLLESELYDSVAGEIGCQEGSLCL